MNIRNGTRYGNQVHPRACACPRCDPDQTKLKAQRARAAAERAAAAAAPPVVLAKSPGARPMRFHRPQTDETRRMRELIREGKTVAQAIEVIESEKHQPKEPTP